MMIVIEGSIGAGKTSLAEELHRRHGGKYISETVATSKLFDKFSDDKARYGASFQFERLGERLNAYLACKNGMWNTYDQSIDFDEWVFAYGNVLDGNITNEEFEVYKELRKLWDKSIVNVQPDVVVSLRISDNLMIDHIKKRGRPEERGDYSYQIKLNKLATDFINNNRVTQKNALIIDIDESSTIEKTTNKVDKFVKDIMHDYWK